MKNREIDEKILDEKIKLVQLRMLEKALSKECPPTEPENYFRVNAKIGGVSYSIDIKNSKDLLAAQRIFGEYMDIIHPPKKNTF